MSGPAPLAPEEWSFWDAFMRAQRGIGRELDRALQRDVGISKAEFSVLVTVYRATEADVRVTDLADALTWDKGQVSHQLGRMERRGLLDRVEAGAAGRRTGVALTQVGRDLATRAIRAHGIAVRRLALDTMSPEEAAAIGAWSRRVLDVVD